MMRMSADGIVSYLGEVIVFLKAFNCLDESHLHYGGNRLYSGPSDCAVNLIRRNTNIETSKIVFGKTSGYGSLANLTHKINHHSRDLGFQSA